MEAYLASIVNHTNRKMLTKLRFIYLFTFFIYYFQQKNAKLRFIYLFFFFSFIYLLLSGEEQRNISFLSICNVMTYV